MLADLAISYLNIVVQCGPINQVSDFTYICIGISAPIFQFNHSCFWEPLHLYMPLANPISDISYLNEHRFQFLLSINIYVTIYNTSHLLELITDP